MLTRQLRAVRRSGCAVQSGNETDPYTRVGLYYQRGESTVDLDHVVALGDGWQKGAQKLRPTLRTRFANDPLNLLSVSASANRQKGDSDAASWLPKDKNYRCAYVARQIAVKHRYRLWVTAAERSAMNRVLLACPTQTVPTAGAGKAAPAPPRPAPLPPPPPSSVYYPNCDAVRAAGKAPLSRGQPGYRSPLDGDGDGVACESWPPRSWEPNALLDPRCLAARRLRAGPAASASVARFDETGLVRVDHRLHPVAQAELAQNMRDVRLDGRLGEEQRRTDLAVRPAPGDQLQHLAFSVGELGQPGRRSRFRAADESLDHPPGYRLREQRPACRDRPDGARQVLGSQ